jgi:Hydrazine synthase alpha subunit middle domain
VFKAHFQVLCRAAVLVALLAATGSSADVTSYTVENQRGATVLTSVTANRGDGTVIFDASKLIKARATHFKGNSPRVVVVPSGSATPAPTARPGLLSLTLNAGLFNPGGQEADLTASPVLSGPDATPGFAVAFERAVQNLPGDDVVLFELQAGQNSPLAGDPIRVAPLEFREGLHAISISAYDIQFENPRAVEAGSFDLLAAPGPVTSLDALTGSPLSRSRVNMTFKALAVGIDLSDLGYAPNVEISGLFLQNTRPGEPAVDPVCIAGLPRPEAPNLLAEEPKSLADHPELLLEQFLASAEADLDEIVFAAHVPGSDHWYANFGYYSSPVREYPPQRAPDGVELPPIFKDGGRLCRLNLRTGALTVLLDDPEGGVRDPQVHYDGGKIVFSYRPGGTPFFHLYEINVDGTGLTQLTDGSYNDIEPTYLPDSGIMFCSDRCMRFVNCWISPVATLYRCEADGSGLRMLSPNVEHDNTPWVLPDGRILYMRWEYVDRSQSHFHHLWTTNPDGTGQMVYYGNERPGYAFLDAKPIPDTNKVVVSFSPGHGRPEHAGDVTVVDPGLGPDEKGSARRISQGGPVFRDPYPISQSYFLVAREREILVMDGNGNTANLYTLPEGDAKLFCHEPRPLRTRARERVIPPRVDPAAPTGQLFLADLYEGRNMEGVARGEVTDLLIFEQLPKPTSFSGGMWPITIGGTFTLARVLGTVPVEPDGSAYMEVPALKPLFLVALDKDGLAVKRMQSFLTVMPGETTGCVGCHERRVETPLSGTRRLTAMRRPPSAITPIEAVPDVLDFPRDVQPILDKHCVRCHNPGDYKGRVDLTGDHSPLFCQSYWTIIQRGLIADGRNEHYGNRPPRTIGSSASPLMKKLDGTHHDVKVSALERDTIRLWIESSAPYAGTYAALGSGMHPVEFPIETMERRCGSCHGSPPPARNPIGKNMYFRFGIGKLAFPLVHDFMELQMIRARMGYYKFGNPRPPQSLCNLTRPEMSPLLRAPLAKDAGGLGLCDPGVFADTTDADYKTILGAIEAAATKHDTEKRFDMAGFRPNDYYIHQMQRYGVLPTDLKPTDPVDAYAVEQAYWDLFVYRPE